MIKQPKLVVKGRRKVSRLKVRGKIKILEKSLFAKTEPFEVKMYDISEGGAKIVSEKQLKSKQEVVLSFQTKEMIKPIEMKGVILWTRILKSDNKDYTLAGLKFYLTKWETIRKSSDNVIRKDVIIFPGNTVMKEIKCPICNKRISSDVLTVKLHTEEHIVEEVKKNHPEWIEKDGVCPICLEHYKKLFRKKIDSHQKKKR